MTLGPVLVVECSLVVGGSIEDGEVGRSVVEGDTLRFSRSSMLYVVALLMVYSLGYLELMLCRLHLLLNHFSFFFYSLCLQLASA